ncbi:hypothetical protein [Allorhodopirellula heiligendammensis]|uniref:hypothetical protein n=1 Tax=Allorhodopirellula heiligendammensis TaxID=2714739 RepID=UPI00265F5A35|nr:hypothetical protein [Allorhodopirellula heiligendammensis]
MSSNLTEQGFCTVLLSAEFLRQTRVGCTQICYREHRRYDRQENDHGENGE